MVQTIGLLSVKALSLYSIHNYFIFIGHNAIHMVLKIENFPKNWQILKALNTRNHCVMWKYSLDIKILMMNRFDTSDN